MRTPRCEHCQTTHSTYARVCLRCGRGVGALVNAMPTDTAGRLRARRARLIRMWLTAVHGVRWFHARPKEVAPREMVCVLRSRPLGDHP